MKKFLTIFLSLILTFTSFPSLVSAGSITENVGKLDVFANQTTNLSEGGDAKVDVTIRNNIFSGNDTNKAIVKNLTVQAVIVNPEKVFIKNDGYVFKDGVDIAPNSEMPGSFSIVAEKDFTTKTVAVNIILKYYLNGQFQTQTETIYVRVNAPEKPINPAIEIRKVDSLWIDTQEAGRDFQVPFEVVNTGDTIAKNIKISLEGLKDNTITLTNGLSTKDITSLSPGQSQFITYNLKSNKALAAGSYMLTLKYSLTSEGGKAPINGDYSFSFNIKKPSQEPSTIEFKNVTFPKGAISRNQTANIGFDLVNTGRLQAKNLKVSALSDNQASLASKSVSQVLLKSLAPGESKHFNFSFIASPSAATGNYPVTLKADFYDESSNDLQSSSQIAGVFIKAPKEKQPGEKDNSPTPKLIIEDYYFEPNVIEAGKPFKMYLKFYNTNTKKAVKNIKIFLTSDTQESVPQGDSNSSGRSMSGGSAPTASVFTPTESSNTFYIANINPGKKVDKEITLTTVPDTAAKTYTVVANFEYEDAEANKYTDTAQIGVPVVQQAKLDVGEILPQSEFTLGMDTNLSVDYYNTGKAVLNNVMVKISGEGLKFDTPTYYKGAFNPGSSDNFSVNITPESPGHKKFVITWTFEDSMGEKQEVTRDFEFDVADMPKEDEGTQEVAPKKSGILGKIIGGLVLIGAAVGTVILIKKRKNKKDNEDMSL